MTEPRPTSPRPGPAVRTAVIPAAGLGTRFLPATKAVPKELLPVVDTPAIEYIVAEAAAHGLTDVLLVTGRGKSALEDHFDRAPELERALEAKGDLGRLAAVRRSVELAQVHAVRQGEALGLGHAVLQAAAHVGERPFACLLGDDIIDARESLLGQMLAVRDRHGGSVLALMPVSREQIQLYGCAEVEVVPGESADVVRVRTTVEKPSPQDAPSDLAVIGRYVLSPRVFDVLRGTKPGRGGEIQLTDAINELAQLPDSEGEPVHGVVFRGLRYDTGDRLEYLKAVVRLASERPEFGADFTAWLRGFVADLPEA
ncbi:MAG: UTP-glucose-phosphate uridylyltransferase [Mycobacterium sp.]|nr:UTP-glucose-phosphate uridylyltransferase [Mycobacterium sp.]